MGEKIKIGKGESVRLLVTATERFQGQYGPNITLAQGNTEFTEKAPRVEQQFRRYGLEPEQVRGMTLELSKTPENGYLDINIVGDDGAIITPKMWQDGARPTVVATPAPATAPVTAPAPAPAPAPSQAPAALPAPVVQHRAAPEAAAAIKGTLEPPAERTPEGVEQFKTAMYARAMLESAKMHADVWRTLAHVLPPSYTIDARAVQATAWSLYGEWKSTR